MRTIIAGSRTITNPAMLEAAIVASGWRAEIEQVVCGEARGADSLGRDWALANGIPVVSYPADWETHKRAAGPIRNAEMANNADALLLLWDGQSRGSANMLQIAENKGLRVYVYTVRDFERRNSAPLCPKCGLRHSDPAHPYCAAMQRIRRCIAAGVVVPAPRRVWAGAKAEEVVEDE
jgi:hypothetical protein